MKKLISVILAVLVIAASVTVGFTVFATDGEGSGSSENQSSSETGNTDPTNETVYTPDAITGLAAESVTTTAVSLKWNESNYATKYVIYRSVESDTGAIGEYTKFASISGKTNTAFNDQGLKAGRIYKYKVFAYRQKNGSTTKGAPASIVVLTVPDNPAAFKATKKTDSSVTLDWDSVSPVTKYNLYRSGEKSDGSYSAFKLVYSGNSTAYKDAGLGSGKFYKYKIIVQRVKAGNDKQSSGKTIKVMTKLTAPANLANKKSTTKSITISWKKVARATKYEVYRKSSGGKASLIKTTSKTKFKDTTVESGANYTYKVRAVRNVNGKKYYSKFSKLTSSTAVVGVKGVRAKSYLSRALLTWDTVGGAAGYDVFIQKGDDYKRKATTVYPRYLSGKLKAGRVYTFAIKSFKTVGSEKIYGSTKYVKVKIKSTAYGKKPKGTWVEVCTETQTLYMYVKNKLFVSTPVVTGNYGPLATTPGYHRVLSKQSPSRLVGSAGGSTWDVTVSYWLGFTWDGQGIHDSTWRGAYGGEIYKGNGSHGCVNTPYAKVAKIFSKAYTGMPVIVY